MQNQKMADKQRNTDRVIVLNYDSKVQDSVAIFK